MTLLELIIALAVLGFVLWLIFTFVPMPSPVRTVIVAVVVLIVVVWLLSALMGGGGLLTRPL